MSNYVKSITFVFENCEFVKFFKGIGDLYIGDFTTEIKRVASNSIAKTTVAKTFFIQLFKECKYESGLFSDEDVNVFDRITQYNDITQIEVEYDDEVVERYFTDYETKSELDAFAEENVNQQSVISPAGNLYLSISATQKLEDFFQPEIDDENKEWLLEADVKAEYDLEKEGYKVLSGEASNKNRWMQVTGSDICFTLFPNETIIRRSGTNESLFLSNQVMYDLCSMFFKYEYLQRELEDTDDELTNIETVRVADDKIEIKNRRTRSKQLLAEYTPSKKPEEVNAKEKSEMGKLYFPKLDAEINGRVMYDILWLLHEILPESFWSSR